MVYFTGYSPCYSTYATVHMLQYICLHVQLFTYFSTLAQRLNCGDGKISDQFSHFKWLKSQQIVVFNLFFVLCSTALHMYEYVEHSERLIYGDNIPATVHKVLVFLCNAHCAWYRLPRIKENLSSNIYHKSHILNVLFCLMN